MSEALGPIQEDVTIARRVEDVWRTLTDEASVPKWLGCMRYAKAVGSVFYMQQDREKASRDDVSGSTHCEILELEAPHRFKFSWFVPGTPATFVTFNLEAVGDSKTRVVLVHDGWGEFPPEQIKPLRDMLAGGWRGYVLPGLVRVAEA